MKIGIPKINDQQFEKACKKAKKLFPEAKIVAVENKFNGMEISAVWVEEVVEINSKERYFTQ